MNNHKELADNAMNVLAAIMGHDRKRLREIAKHLKQQDGEAWAIGEMIERACSLLEKLD